MGLIGPFVLGGFWYPLMLVSIIAVGAGGFWFRCVHCGHQIVRQKMTIGTREMTGYTSFPGKTCSNCGKDVSGQ
ncbi:hypothetical protein [Brevundimonas sp. NIBR11]|uniref:hypothetical protein n=1 Tax=Brevundimonas sp. NIBR11 TaxID=3015999 RepID=UPI0022F1069D|nr:hypothetical protein [Brevundimonas sp. NIBR11]